MLCFLIDFDSTRLFSKASPAVENGAAKSAPRTPRGCQEAAKSASGTLREAAGGAPGGLTSEVEKRSVLGR